MSAVVRLGDIDSGHGCWPPRPNVQASINHMANGIGIHRQGDGWATHCCGPSCHAGVAAQGSSTVFTNGKQRMRIGDPVSCGSTCAEGSPNVFAGG